MADQWLTSLLQWIETWGVWLSWVAWISVFGGALAMAWVLRCERRRAILGPAIIVAALALGAHLADYFITLARSPDLSLEMNPLWRNVVHRYGLMVAKWYGLTGKLLVSTLAGQMTAFYLANRPRLYPTDRSISSVTFFMCSMGARSRTVRERLAALFTVFAFFFAGLTFVYFYIAYTNWELNAEVQNRLPSVPLAVATYVTALCAAFVALTYKAFRNNKGEVCARGAAGGKS